jgi:hypothetical protein
LNAREFILESAQSRYAKHRSRNPETDVVSACLHVCRMHRAVAWAERINTGAGRIWNDRDKKLSQFIRFGFRGAPDIIGLLRGGRMLLIECKFGKPRLSTDQRRVLEHSACEGAFVIVTTDPVKLSAELDHWG